MYNNLPQSIIIDAVCQALNIDDIAMDTRKPQYASARFIAIKLMLDHGRLSYSQIAEILKRDITTIYFGESRFNKLIKSNDAFIGKWYKVKLKIADLCASN